ncbi:MAG: 1,4-dihydroxy-2-naphthoate polyprenyltransferase, partial [Ilumatobacteraceae bacterium]
MTSVGTWVAGARPRTLPAAIVPVVIGAAAATTVESVAAERYVVHGGLALVVSLALQIAVNYANDYSDGVRGTDDRRTGPMRLVGSGAASPATVKRAALVSFGVAAVGGASLAALTTWWLIPVGAVSMLAGWTYTGGPKPYGYLGLGELFVFVFFGLVATAGTTYVIAGTINRLSIASGSLAGVLAVALLVVNNLRDIDSDRASGKRTLAVRIGDSRTRDVYVLMYLLAAVAVGVAVLDVRSAAVGLVGVLSALPAIATVRSARTAGELIAALAMTARAQLVIG